jgi:hypothetical protein
LKLPAPAGNAPAEPAMPPMAPEAEAPTDNLDFGGETPTEPTQEMPEAPADDNPFDKEPFDAGIDVDEESDPKKFIEKLSGKIGQSLRDYTKKQGQPDFELEKFAINSLISATHTSEMDENDRNDIIKKINKAGENDSENPDMGDDNNDANSGDDNNDGVGADFGGDSQDGMEENTLFEEDSIFLENTPKCSLFAPEGSPEFMEQNRIAESEGLWANIHAKRERGESPAKPGDKGYPDKKQWNKLTKEGENESNNYMFWQNLKTIHHASGELLNMGQDKVDEMVANGHAWAVDHISTSADDIEEVYHFIEANIEGEDYNGETEGGYNDENLTLKEKNTIFDKNMLKTKLQESFNQENMSEPLVEPIVKPTTKPAEPTPSRRNRPFTIEPDTIPQVDPKAIK